MLIFSFFAVLVLGLAAWADIHTLRGVLAARKRAAGLNTLALYPDFFHQPPGRFVDPRGAIRYLRWESTDFVVSVAAPSRLRFKVRASVPSQARAAALAQLPEAKAQQLLQRCFVFEHEPGGGPWSGDVAEAVASALSEIGPFYGEALLEARSGRMVLDWSRWECASAPDMSDLTEQAAVVLARIVELLTPTIPESPRSR